MENDRFSSLLAAAGAEGAGGGIVLVPKVKSCAK